MYFWGCTTKREHQCLPTSANMGVDGCTKSSSSRTSSSSSNSKDTFLGEVAVVSCSKGAPAFPNELDPANCSVPPTTSISTSSASLPATVLSSTTWVPWWVDVAEKMEGKEYRKEVKQPKWSKMQKENEAFFLRLQNSTYTGLLDKV